MFIRIVDPESYCYLVESETVHDAWIWADENLDYYGYQCKLLHCSAESAQKKIAFGIPAFKALSKADVAKEEKPKVDPGLEGHARILAREDGVESWSALQNYEKESYLGQAVEARSAAE